MSALCLATLEALKQRLPNMELTLVHHGVSGGGAASIIASEFGVEEMAVRHSRRYYRGDTFTTIRWAARTGILSNKAANRLRDADAVVDISGGDSFTDLYGRKRFRAVIGPKQLALELGKPLVLLPQTYGPFSDGAWRKQAQHVVQRCTMAWARDERSFAVLRELAGASFTPDRHCCGVDVAVLLPCVKPDDDVQFLFEKQHPLVGLNISGLLYNSPAEAIARYGLRAEYGTLVKAFAQRLLEESDAKLVLIPHVNTPSKHPESDGDACRSLLDSLPRQCRHRAFVAPEFSDPRHAKWLISQMDWFCGTRMHSTIAALSTGVPCAAIAYSIKTAGVFETFDLGSQVVDPRKQDTSEAADALWSCFESRNMTQQILSTSAPRVRRRAHEQADAIAILLDNLCARSTRFVSHSTVHAEVNH